MSSPTICLCCADSFATPAPDNANLCAECGDAVAAAKCLVEFYGEPAALPMARLAKDFSQDVPNNSAGELIESRSGSAS